jgi:hypothetical protein
MPSAEAVTAGWSAFFWVHPKSRRPENNNKTNDFFFIEKIFKYSLIILKDRN